MTNVLQSTIVMTVSPQVYRKLGLTHYCNPHQFAPRANQQTDFWPSISNQGASSAPIRFPPNNFKHFFFLFKFLFIFLLWCQFTISLLPVFSLRRNLPSDLGCISKQSNSQTAPHSTTGSRHDGALTLSSTPFQRTYASPPLRTLLQTIIQTPRAPRFAKSKGYKLCVKKFPPQYFRQYNQPYMTLEYVTHLQPQHKHKPMSNQMQHPRNKKCA